MSRYLAPEETWDRVMACIEAVEVRCRLRELLHRAIQANKKECGNCDHWMKMKLCPKETGSVKTGSPSMGTLACSQFYMQDAAKRLRDKFRAEAVEYARKHNLECPDMAGRWVR